MDEGDGMATVAAAPMIERAVDSDTARSAL